MVDQNRIDSAIDSVVASDMEQQGVRPMPSFEGDSPNARIDAAVDAAFQADVQNNRLPDIGLSADLGSLQAETPSFADAYRAGTDQFRSNIDFTQALIGDLIGNEEMFNEAVERAGTRDQISAGLMAGGTDFRGLVEDPSMGGGLQFAKQTLGQLAPMALESAAGALVGGMIGGPVGAGAGASGGTGLMARVLLRKELRDRIKESTAGRAAADPVLSGLLRNEAARRGAVIGATATEFRQGTGETFRETAEAGDPSPGVALATAAPFALIGVLPEKLIVDTLADAVKGASPQNRRVIQSALGGVSRQATAEGVAEAGQEELLIQLHDRLSEEDYAGTDDAFWRRGEGFVAGAIGGGAVGGVAGATTAAVDKMRRGEVDEPQRPPEQIAFDNEVEETLRLTEVQDTDQGPQLQRDMLEDDAPLPESQADIDAQFTAMMGDRSAKQAVEITDGSPLPSGYQRGMEGIVEVETENGLLLTTEPEVADMVAQEGGSSDAVARALGYRTPKNVGMSRGIVARNEAGNVVHSELIADDEPSEQALARGRQFAPNVEFQDAEQAVTERADRVRAEGRDPELEASLVRLNKTEQALSETAHRLEVLERARQMPEHQERWSEINRRIPLLRDQIAQLTERHTQQERQANDLTARATRRTDLRNKAEQNDRLVGEAVMQARDETGNRLDGVEFVDRYTGEARTIPRDVFEAVAQRMREQDPSSVLTEEQGIERMAQEFEDRGYILNQNDARPIQVEETTPWDAQRDMVSEREIDPNDPASFRDASQRRASPRQVLRRTYHLGPETDGTWVGDQVIPTAAVRKLRELRRKFPEDDWSIIQFQREDGDWVNAIQRRQSFANRRADDPVTRDVEGTDSDAIELTRQIQMQDGGYGRSVQPDPSISPSARERVFAATEQARWRSRDREAPSDFSLVMSDPDGRLGYYNPRVIANAGMDANQYLVANTRLSEAERRRLGLYTALAILHEAGFRYDMGTVEAQRPVTQGRRRQAARHNTPTWTEVAGQWENMSLQQKQEVADQAQMDLTENELNDMSARDLPNEMQEVLRQMRDEVFVAQQEASVETDRDVWHKPESWTNRDTVGMKVLAMVSDGVRIDPVINPILRTIFGQAKNEAGLQRSVFVITDKTNRDMIRSLPKDIQDQMSEDPNMVALLTGQAPPNLRGRTAHYDGGSVIWLNSNMKGDIQSLTLAHELGHVAFHEHMDTLANAPENAARYQRIRTAFRRARAEGVVKQYQDPRTGFEEWFADRFAAWVHNRDAVTQGVARSGGFSQLLNALRGIASRLRVTAKSLTEAGSPAMEARLRRNRAIEEFYDGIAKSHALKRNLELARRGVVEQATNPDYNPAEVIQQRLEELEGLSQIEIEQEMLEDPDVQLALARAELDAATQEVPMSPGMYHMLHGNDPVAAEQIRRSSERAENGDSNRPTYNGDTGDSTRNLNIDNPRPRIEFDEDLESQPGSPDPERRQDFQPEEGGGGAGGQVPPGGNEPPGGPQEPDEPPFDRNRLYEAVMGNARRWGLTETFQKVRDWINENLGPVMERGYKALRDLTWTDDARLRRMGAQGRRLANWFYDDTFDRNTTGPRGYLNAVEMELARWMSEVESVLPESKYEADAALREAQSGRPTRELSRDGKRIRRMLRRFYNEQLSDVEGLRMRNNYFPRVYDMAQVMAHSDRFSQLLVDAGYTETEASRIIQSMMEGESNVELSTMDQEGAGPGMSSRLHRQLENLDDSVLQQEGFLIEPRAALMQYLRSAVKRSEYEKRFAGDMSLTEVYRDLQRRQAEGKWIDPEFMESTRTRFEEARDPDSIMVRDPSARIKQLINRMPQEQQAEARQIVENYMGRSNTLFGKQLPPPLARTISTVGGAMYMATLGLATISQITDFGAIILRTRGAEGIGMFHRAIMQVPRDERLAFARAVGSISHQANLDALRMTYGNDFMTPTMRKMTDTFFKAIGLEQITNFSRSVATNMGAEFVSVHATKAAAGDPRSQRYLNELRLTPQQVFEWENNGRQFTGDSGVAVREALFQFTDESVLRPNAAMRPGWASNPWFTLMWQLKSFAWGFYKVMLRGVANEVISRRREGATISDQVAPIAMAGALMLPLAFSSMVIRDIAKEGLNSAFDDDEYQWNSARNRSSTEWMLELTDRAGLLGPWAIVNSAHDAHEWGENPALTLLGPAAERVGHLAKGEFGRVADDMIPVAGLVR